MFFHYYWAKFFKKIRGKAIKNTKIHPSSKVEAGCEINNSIIDRYSFCGYNCEVNNCHIGSFCSIANNVIIGGEMHPMDWVSTSPVFYKGRDSINKKFSEYERVPSKKVNIGHDVWIGHNVIIKQGLNIGIGAVIGMGSIVTKDVEPYAIVAGSPAKIIRKRFEQNIINELLNSKWWELEDKKLSELALYIKKPQEFINKL